MLGGPHTLPPPPARNSPPQSRGLQTKQRLIVSALTPTGPARPDCGPTLGTTPAFSPGSQSRNGPDLSLCVWGTAVMSWGGSQLGQNPHPAPSPPREPHGLCKVRGSEPQQDHVASPKPLLRSGQRSWGDLAHPGGPAPSQGSHQAAAGGSAVRIVHPVDLLNELHEDPHGHLRARGHQCQQHTGNPAPDPGWALPPRPGSPWLRTRGKWPPTTLPASSLHLSSLPG